MNESNACFLRHEKAEVGDIFVPTTSGCDFLFQSNKNPYFFVYVRAKQRKATSSKNNIVAFLVITHQVKKCLETLF